MRRHDVQRRRATATVLSLAVVLLAGCAGTTGPEASVAFPDDPRPDYQLGGAYPPAEGVNIVVRDRNDEPATGLFSICYINAFQTQPGESATWDDDLVLRDAQGTAVADPAWPDEYLLDISTSDRRVRIADRVGTWIDECAAAGFDAVEFDNLDSPSRSSGRVTTADAESLAALLVTRAHTAGLAAAQKNVAEHSTSMRTIGFDFAIAEGCAQFDECDAYVNAYGDAVIAIEYSDAQDVPFASFCESSSRPSAAVLRDRDLTTPGEAGYVARWCR